MSQKRRTRRKLKASGIKGITDLKVLEINLRRFLLEYQVEKTHDPEKTIVILKEGFGIVFPEDMPGSVLEFEFETDGTFSMMRFLKEIDNEREFVSKYPEDESNNSVLKSGCGLNLFELSSLAC